MFFWKISAAPPLPDTPNILMLEPLGNSPLIALLYLTVQESNVEVELIQPIIFKILMFSFTLLSQIELSYYQ